MSRKIDDFKIEKAIKESSFSINEIFKVVNKLKIKIEQSDMEPTSRCPIDSVLEDFVLYDDVKTNMSENIWKFVGEHLKECQRCTLIIMYHKAELDAWNNLMNNKHLLITSGRGLKSYLKKHDTSLITNE
jgi:hypothetical protein